jgi:hypothetical protein
MLFRASTKRVTLLRFYGANLSGFSNTAKRLEIINRIRNGIVHHGDEPFIQFSDDQPIIRLPKKYPNDKTNKLPNILGLDESIHDYPLFDYLKVLTHHLFEFMENLGTTLFQKEVPFDLWILDNKCMEEFINYFRYDIEKHIRKTADGKGYSLVLLGLPHN